jgi:uncharacterized protein YnzC (UPF0291/DUF896 family)
MITSELIEKINFYAAKAKSEGLTEDEKKEQERLREEYLGHFRKRFRQQLDNMDIEYID